MLSDQPDIKYYTVALKIGKKNEHILNRFFNRMTGFPPNDFRTEKSDRKKLQKKVTEKSDNGIS